MAIKIESPDGRDALTEFVLFHDQVYEYRAARWRSHVGTALHFLSGEGPAAAERKLRAFIARDGDRMLARVLAVVDDRYRRHWNERLGHATLFEALPGTRDAVRQMMDAACEWLRSNGTEAARAGYYFPVLDTSFAIDDYESLPPAILRQNPDYYHTLLKDAGFETEKGFCDFKIEVTPALVERWQSALESARRAGFEIVPLKNVPAAKRVRDFTPTFNDAFSRHWGFIPNREDEMGGTFEAIAPAGGLDTSVLAYRDGAPVGALLVVPDASARAVLKPARVLRDSERLNTLAIAVSEPARGRGVNLAMASYAFLELVRRGQKFVSYTYVVDDNWASRRTAGKLGASVCANYVAYRRNFRR